MECDVVLDVGCTPYGVVVGGNCDVGGYQRLGQCHCPAICIFTLMM